MNIGGLPKSSKGFIKSVLKIFSPPSKCVTTLNPRKSERNLCLNALKNSSKVSKSFANIKNLKFAEKYCPSLSSSCFISAICALRKLRFRTFLLASVSFSLAAALSEISPSAEAMALVALSAFFSHSASTGSRVVICTNRKPYSRVKILALSSSSTPHCSGSGSTRP